jgi:N6-adenosine-specific RNA methylase IME4
MSLDFHPLANLFPLIEGMDFRDLVEDVRANGLRDAVILHEGQILDGRNRYRACHAAQVDCRFEQFTGADPLAFVVSKNLRRRHLDASQRSMAAARLGRLGWGGDRSKPSNEGLPTKQRADLMKVGKASVERAQAVLDNGAVDLIEAVEHGRIAVAAAEQALQLAKEDQRRVVEQVAAGRKNAVSTAVKKLKRSLKERALANSIAALPDKKYGVILADPEWKFDVWGEESGRLRTPENHYPTSETDDILTRPVGDIAADDCVLFLWATAPKLLDALKVVDAWGFTYVTHAIWVKDRIGTGYWLRNKHEILIIAKRGNPPKPADGTQWHSALEGQFRGHSVKPDWQYELIEAYFPNVPKIELNARRARDGWDRWGNEAPPTDAAGAEVEHDPTTGEAVDEAKPDDLSIPPFLKREPAEASAPT